MYLVQAAGENVKDVILMYSEYTERERDIYLLRFDYVILPVPLPRLTEL